MDVSVYVTKRVDPASGACARIRVANVGTPPAFLADVARALHGRDPAHVLPAIPDLLQRVPTPVRPLALDFFAALRAACMHCQRVRVMRRPALEQRLQQSDGGTVVADLYQDDFRVVVTE